MANAVHQLSADSAPTLGKLGAQIPGTTKPMPFCVNKLIQLLGADKIQRATGRSRSYAVLVGLFAAEGPHKVLETIEFKTATEWCEFYEVEVKEDAAIVFKAVGNDYKSPHGVSYAPSTIPRAPDWDGGRAECGGGYHFAASPKYALRFNPGASRFVACPVSIKEFAPHPEAKYPDKIKAPGCCAPVWEVDIDGNPIQAEKESPK